MFGKTVAKALTVQEKSKRKFYLFAIIALVNIFGISAASIAWFDVVAKSAAIDAVSGDLNVSIEKVTAHKHVYPFYENSTEYIDYDSPGLIKAYVSQDAGSTNLTLSGGAGVCHDSNDEGSVSDIQYQSDAASRYYLVGNASFSGEGTPWSTSSGRALSARDAVSVNVGAVLENTSLAVGDEFILFDKGSVSDGSFVRYSYATTELNRRFEMVTDEGANPRLKCLKAGTYDFVFYLVPGNEDNTIPMLSICLSQNNARPNYSDNTSMTMTTTRAACHSIATPGTKTNIHYETDRIFRYYLVGDETFTGVSANPWSTMSGAAFSLQEAVTTTKSAVLSNVLVGVGAEFTLIDTSTISTIDQAVGYSRFIYTINSAYPRFEVTPEGNLRCLKSGIYTFTYNLVEVESVNVPTLTIVPSRDGDGDAFIGNDILDPTMIAINYAGGGTGYGTIQAYLPEAIHEQKTMVVLDVELRFNNANMVDVGLEIRRTGNGANPYMYSLTGASGYENNPYTNTTAFTSSSVNTIYASDFYRYYAVFQKEPLANPWTYFYNNYWDPDPENPNYAGGSFDKFTNDKSESFLTTIQCDLDHSNNQKKVYTIPASSSVEAGTTYHCYVGIDYDDVYTDFFLAPERLGKTYHLNRDFFLYFTSTQHISGGGQ